MKLQKPLFIGFGFVCLCFSFFIALLEISSSFLKEQVRAFFKLMFTHFNKSLSLTVE